MASLGSSMGRLGFGYLGPRVVLNFAHVEFVGKGPCVVFGVSTAHEVSAT